MNDLLRSSLRIEDLFETQNDHQNEEETKKCCHAENDRAGDDRESIIPCQT